MGLGYFFCGDFGSICSFTFLEGIRNIFGFLIYKRGSSCIGEGLEFRILCRFFGNFFRIVVYKLDIYLNREILFNVYDNYYKRNL